MTDRRGEGRSKLSNYKQRKGEYIMRVKDITPYRSRLRRPLVWPAAERESERNGVTCDWCSVPKGPPCSDSKNDPESLQRMVNGPDYRVEPCREAIRNANPDLFREPELR